MYDLNKEPDVILELKDGEVVLIDGCEFVTSVTDIVKNGVYFAKNTDLRDRWLEICALRPCDGTNPVWDNKRHYRSDTSVKKRASDYVQYIRNACNTKAIMSRETMVVLFREGKYRLSEIGE